MEPIRDNVGENHYELSRDFWSSHEHPDKPNKAANFEVTVGGRIMSTACHMSDAEILAFLTDDDYLSERNKVCPENVTHELSRLAEAPGKALEILRSQATVTENQSTPKFSIFQFLRNLLSPVKPKPKEEKRKPVVNDRQDADVQDILSDLRSRSYSAWYRGPFYASNVAIRDDKIELNGQNFRITNTPTITRGAVGLDDSHEKSASKYVFEPVVLRLFRLYKNLNKEVLIRRIPEAGKMIDRAKRLIQADLELLIQKKMEDNTDSIAGDEIYYLEHRLLGGLANDAESIAPFCMKIALDEAKNAMIAKYIEQGLTSLKNVQFHNTCLTRGKELLGQPTKDRIPPMIHDLITSLEIDKVAFQSKWREIISNDIKKANPNTQYPPGDNYDQNVTSLTETQLKLLTETQLKLLTDALEKLKNPDSFSQHSFNDYKVTRAAYINIAAEITGQCVTGCKSGLDRLGGLYTTMETFKCFHDEFGQFPDKNFLKSLAQKNPGTLNSHERVKRDFLCENSLRIYQSITAKVGNHNRGVQGTKTYEQFLSADIKIAFNNAHREAKKSEDYANTMDELTEITNGTEKFSDTDLMAMIKCDPQDPNYLHYLRGLCAQDALNIRYMARNALTFEDIDEFERASKDKYEKELTKLRSKLIAKNDDVFTKTMFIDGLRQFGNKHRKIKSVFDFLIKNPILALVFVVTFAVTTLISLPNKKKGSEHKTKGPENSERITEEHDNSEHKEDLENLGTLETHPGHRRDSLRQLQETSSDMKNRAGLAAHNKKSKASNPRPNDDPHLTDRHGKT